MKRESRAPLIVAIVLLVLPVLYVGSYLALVVPGGFSPVTPIKGSKKIAFQNPCEIAHFRCGVHRAALFFWPLEQIDRKLRPGAWETDLDFRFSDDSGFGFQPP
ncbi:hypothetical protein [Anatilimnocola floriformis]|uniref:hypothetical protein n=1 Tax=Anatilimnocola floriformis TaxID=2948575 RepID=UPI0020C43B5B|nr:hypothetical protein [Anatilimnocola floriformis]